jgi:NAD(P)-dependent dehydrogenase (short-subunit alcohol dehydrogenase family)
MVDLYLELETGIVCQICCSFSMPGAERPGVGLTAGVSFFIESRPIQQHRRPRRREITMATKVWFITGTSKGFGRVWAEAALARGDRVTATARDVKTLAPLVERYGEQVAALTLDVTDKSAVGGAIAAAHARFGRLDVVINNAGYGLFGTIEEVSEAEARAQIETNLFGALWVTQAVLPIMRAQGSGHIIQISSIGGVNAFPTVGLYHASKWGLEGFSQSLAAEVKGFGIKVTIVEPGGFATEWGGPSAKRATQIPAYDGARATMASFRSSNVPGDPEATGAAMLKVVDAQEPPLRIFFGSGGLPLTRKEYAKRIETWEKWNDVSLEAQGDSAARQAR